ncbi:DUF262 domain-containing protein [Geosporobacter ferrireducens]|uniref:DUF262 domain-containing protein n=1 Tax=Geosporobacter ferrireducens TaxID=1424294 RepID=A0A1D8GPI3_9FIRM|nr:DUF262 domain-containing protein [Geosporobacter ferrireducens]AOT72788.1 hypothetical protein Gferi_26465 [Geosporobacter ferrireducens]
MKNKSITADEISIHDLLNNKNEIYSIPVYQRAYEWGKDQLEDLWEDISSLADDEDIHFLGSIVVVSDIHKKSFNRFEIVDGQQRITSILLFLIAIRDLYLENGNENNAKYINDNYIYSSNFDSKKSKLQLGRNDNSIFEMLVERIPIPSELRNRKVYIAYSYFKTKLESQIVNLRQITDKLLFSVSLVLIGTNSYYDAFRLFETLNNRGLELSAVDLIKNDILSKISNNNFLLNRGIELWDNLIKNLSSQNIDKVKFFRHYLFSTESGIVSKPKLYSKYQDLIEKNDDLVGFLEDMFLKSEIYRKIYNSIIGSKHVNYQIAIINRIEISTSYTLLLKLFSEHNMTDDTICSILKAIEIFSLRRSICNTTTRDLDRIFNHLAIHSFSQENPVKYIVEYLKTRTPSDEEFFSSFKDRDFLRDDQTKYILESIENFITNNTNEKTMNNRQDVHIEHIMPVEIHSGNAKKSFGDWEYYLGEDATKHKSFVNRIGNLTLLGSGLNISASNNPFQAKTKIYSYSNIQITKKLCNYEKWGLKEISKRGEELAKAALLIWNYAGIEKN